MPSKSEIKKNPKRSKVEVIKPTRVAAGKKATVMTQPLASKAISKKVIKTVSKASDTKGLKKPSLKKVTKSAKESISVAKSAAPTIEQITARAHQMWLDEGCPEGRADIHWQLAESELTQS